MHHSDSFPRNFSQPLAAFSVLVAVMLTLNLPAQEADKPDDKPYLRMSAVVKEAGPDTREFSMVYEGGETQSYHILNTALITEKDIVKAEPLEKQDAYIIRLTFNEEGAEKFALTTRQLLGKQLAILLNDRLIMAPRINDAITGGKAEISGNFSKEEVEEMIRQINSRLKPGAD